VGDAPLDPGLFVDTRGWADDAPAEQQRKASGNTGRNGVADGKRRKESPFKDGSKEDTGSHGLEQLLEGDGGADQPTQERRRPATPTPPSLPVSQPKPTSMQTSGRMSAMVQDAPATTKPKRKPATTQVAVVVVVLMLVLASAGMAIYYFKH
jgi:hypothetical protein